MRTRATRGCGGLSTVAAGTSDTAGRTRRSGCGAPPLRMDWRGILRCSPAGSGMAPIAAFRPAACWPATALMVHGRPRLRREYGFITYLDATNDLPIFSAEQTYLMCIIGLQPTKHGIAVAKPSPSAMQRVDASLFTSIKFPFWQNELGSISCADRLISHRNSCPAASSPAEIASR